MNDPVKNGFIVYTHVIVYRVLLGIFLYIPNAFFPTCIVLNLHVEDICTTSQTRVECGIILD